MKTNIVIAAVCFIGGVSFLVKSLKADVFLKKERYNFKDVIDMKGLEKAYKKGNAALAIVLFLLALAYFFFKNITVIAAIVVIVSALAYSISINRYINRRE